MKPTNTATLWDLWKLFRGLQSRIIKEYNEISIEDASPEVFDLLGYFEEQEDKIMERISKTY